MRERGKEREIEREKRGRETLNALIQCAYGPTTEHTERENGLQSSSSEVQTVLRAKFSNILSAQADKTVMCVRACMHHTVFSRADSRLTTVNRHYEAALWLLENTFRFQNSVSLYSSDVIYYKKNPTMEQYYASRISINLNLYGVCYNQVLLSSMI